MCSHAKLFAINFAQFQGKVRTAQTHQPGSPPCQIAFSLTEVRLINLAFLFRNVFLGLLEDWQSTFLVKNEKKIPLLLITLQMPFSMLPWTKFVAAAVDIYRYNFLHPGPTQHSTEQCCPEGHKQHSQHKSKGLRLSLQFSLTIPPLRVCSPFGTPSCLSGHSTTFSLFPSILRLFVGSPFFFTTYL